MRALILSVLAGLTAVPMFSTAAVAMGDRSPEDMAAQQALMQGQIDAAVMTAKRITAANPRDGEAYLVLCRSFYAEGHANDAINACERAVQRIPQSSEAHDWLGRAYGTSAEHAGPIAGLTLAWKVKAAFESAVALDPKDAAAVNDLSEFYVDAPVIVGGGLEKAAELADRVQGELPQSTHRIRALAAEKREDFGTAEREFRAAVEVANRADAWVDLGAFYERRGQDDRSVEALRHALARDAADDASLVDVASLLNEMHREPELAKKALRDYLGSAAMSDAAPAARVHVMLGRMLASEGDRQGAKIEFEKALQMASGYGPAKQALQQL